MEKDSRRKRHRESKNDDEEGDYSSDEEESYETTVQRPFKQRRPRQQEQGPHGEESRQEPELPVAPTLDEFRQDPNLYRPRREWFRCSSRKGVGLDSSFFIPEVYFGEEYDSALHNCIRRGHVDAAQKLILEGKDAKLPDAIRIGIAEGMQDFTMSLKDLIDKELIDRPTAFEVAPNKDALKMALKGIQVSQPVII